MAGRAVEAGKCRGPYWWIPAFLCRSYKVSFCFSFNLLFHDLLSTWLIYVCSATEVDNGFKKPGLSRTPRYTDTRLDEVFAAKKSRFRFVSGKENAKVIIFAQFIPSILFIQLTSSLNYWSQVVNVVEIKRSNLVTVFRKIQLWSKLVMWKIFQFSLHWRLRESKEFHGSPHSLCIFLVSQLCFSYYDSLPTFLPAWRILLLQERIAKMVYCKLVKQMKSAAKGSFLVFLSFHQLLIDLLVWQKLLTWYTLAAATDLFLYVYLHFRFCWLYHK